MRSVIALSTLALLLALSACSGGAVKEADAFISVRDEVTSAWAKEIDANPNDVGVENMRKIFEEKKADLVAKKEAFMKVSDKASGKSWQRLSDTISMERKLTDAAVVKFATTSAATSAKLRELVKDYDKTVEIPHLL